MKSIMSNWPVPSSVAETPNFFSSVPTKPVAMMNGAPDKTDGCTTTQ